ncbi:MAG: hypothetical protein CBB71_10595 [Rhodopirellula sp. TMED11]|nr:MAG: hypothetical protein CBB71_10595 [Rhodopirellula sp. TMED11]
MSREASRRIQTISQGGESRPMRRRRQPTEMRVALPGNSHSSQSTDSRMFFFAEHQRIESLMFDS